MTKVFSILTAVAVVVSATAAAEQPLWSVPFSVDSLSRLTSAVTTAARPGGPSVAAVVAEQRNALSVLNAKTGNRTHVFKLSMEGNPVTLSPSVVAGNMDTTFYAWSTVSGANLWTAPAVFFSSSNEHVTALTTENPRLFEVRDTTTGALCLSVPPRKNNLPIAKVSGRCVVVLWKAWHYMTTITMYRLGTATLDKLWAIDFNVTDSIELGLQAGPATGAGEVPYAIVNAMNRGRQWIIHPDGRVLPFSPFPAQLTFDAEPVSRSTVLAIRAPPQASVVSIALYNVGTGNVEWTKSVDLQFLLSSVRVFGDVVVIFTKGDSIALDTHSGKSLWTKQGPIRMGWASGPDGVAVAADDNTVQVWARRTGAVLSKTGPIPGLFSFVTEPALGLVVAHTAKGVSAYKLL